MKNIEKLDLKLEYNGGGLVHDSRKDVRTLARVCNALHDKVNDLIDENNSLKERIKRIESNQQINQPLI